MSNHEPEDHNPSHIESVALTEQPDTTRLPQLMPEDESEIRRILESAIWLSPEERHGYIDEQVAGRERLRQPLLDVLDDLDGSTARPDFDGGAPRGTPEQVGPYRIEACIGQGGMGIVYKAKQEHPLPRTVAIKMIKPGMDSRQVLARFAGEREALARMTHPNIATVLSAGTHDGRPYFSMEYVPGVPITEYCDSERLTIRRRLELFRDVCLAIQHAHQKGVIHRDITPRNVLITRVDSVATPKVIDFGLAKALGAPLGGVSTQTAHGQFLGTPNYASPEQAAGNVDDLDARSDIYSLGVILYELLTGSPTLGPDSSECSREQLLRLIREIEPPVPSRRISRLDGDSSTAIASRRDCSSHHAMVRQVRGELDWITMKALEKDPRLRYQSASELAQEVDRYLRDEPVLVSQSTLYLVGKLIRRHQRSLVQGGLAAGLLAGAVVGLGAWRHFHRESAFAVIARDLAGLEASAKALGCDELVPGIEDLTIRAERSLPLEDLVHVYRRVATIYLDCEQFELAAPVIVSLVEHTGTEASLQMSSGLQWTIELARASRRSGKTELAVDLAHEARQSVQRGPHNEVWWVDASFELAYAYAAAGQIDASIDALRELHTELPALLISSPEAVTAVLDRRLEEYFTDSALELGSESFLSLINVIGGSYLDAGLRTKAALMLHDVHGRLQTELAVGDPVRVESAMGLSEVLFQQDRTEEAIDLVEQELDLARQRLPDWDHNPESRLPYIDLLYHYAVALQRTNHLGEAETVLRDLPALHDRKHGEFHHHSIAVRTVHGTVLRLLGHYERAEAVYEDALKRCLKASELRPSFVTQIERAVGKVRQDQKSYRESIEPLRSALHTISECCSDNAPLVGGYQLSLARSLVPLGQFDEAERLLLEAYTASTTDPTKHYWLGQDTARTLVELYERWGRPDDAALWRERLNPMPEGQSPGIVDRPWM